MPAPRFPLPFVVATLFVVGFFMIRLGSTTTIAANETAQAESGALSLFAGKDEVTALFHVASEPTRLLSDVKPISNWEVFSKTQLAYLKSSFVLQSALRADGISQLPLIREQSDPIAWLQSQLEVGYQANSSILYVKLRGSSADTSQLRTIVDAVCDAYLKEVVFDEEQRQLVVRDALQRSFSNLSDEIREKSDMTHALSRDIGFADTDGKARVMQDLDLKRIDRIETELLRLEDEQLAAKVYAEQEGNKISPKERAQLTFYEKRIEELSKRQAELESRIINRNQSSVELEIGLDELKQLRKIAADMSFRLEEMDVESVAPDRIRLIQKAN